MADLIIMSNKEAARVPVLEQVKQKMITQKTAATMLGLNPRQIRRLLKRYRKEGAAGLTHGNRGKPSNHQAKAAEVEAAITYLQQPSCYDFAPTFAHEQLVKNQTITFGVDTLRKVMVENQLWTPRERKRLHPHQFRERMHHFGDMVQLDGSPHDWFESRVDPETGVPVGECTLHTAIDDATGRFKGWFGKEETTKDYFYLIERYLKEEGKPGSTYSDRHSIFTVNTAESNRVLTQDPYHNRDQEYKTQFERAMKELAIGMILASSAQAKGRVEKLNSTLQNRLVKEMRLRNICNMETANAYLLQFEAEFNRQFGVKPNSPENAHRPLTDWEKAHLDEILAFQVTRTLSKNLTCQWDHVIYQIQAKRSGYGLRQAKVRLCKTLTREVKITYQQHVLPYTTFVVSPKQWTPTTKQVATLARTNTTAPQTFWEAFAENNWNTYDADYQLA